MKKLFVLIMSLQLICSPIAFAATGGASGGAGSATGGSTGGAANDFRENPNAGPGAEFYAAQVVTLAGSCLGTSILVSCSLGAAQPSLLIYMASSIVHIASEILGAKAMNDNHIRGANDLKMLDAKLDAAKGAGEMQRFALQKAREEEQATLDFVENRAIWMTLITVGYWGATAAATVEAIIEGFPPWKPSEAACHGSGVPLSMLTAGLIGVAYGFANSAPNSDTSIVVKIGTPILTLLAVTTGLGGVISAAYGHGIPRAVTMGVNAALATWITSELWNKVSVLKENIDKLDAILAAMDKDGPEGITTPPTTAGSGSAAGGNGGGANGGTPRAGNYHTAKTGIEDLPVHKLCANGDFSPSCKNPVRVPRPQFEAGMDNPDLKQLSNMVVDAGNAMADGNVAGARVLAGNAGASAIKAKQIAESMQKKLNDKLKAEGKAPIDFKGAAKKKLDEMIGMYNHAAAQKGAPVASASSASLDASPVNASNDNGPKGALGDGSAARGGGGGSGMSSFKTDTAADIPAGSGSSPTISDSLAKFESPVNDINKDSEVSLFSLISNRYVLNYAKVLKKKEVKDKPTVPVPTN